MSLMPDPLQLPQGLTQRPLTTADTAAVTAVIAAQELADVGEVVIEEADIVADWQRPGYDVGAESIGVFDGDRLVAYADTTFSGRGDVAVLPEMLGRGLGTELSRWLRERAREKGWASIGSPVPAGSPGDVLLEELGYHVRWTSWVLRLPEGATVPRRPLPEGYAVRAATPDQYEAVWTVQEDAFLEWSVRERETFEEWEATTTKRPGFEPWNLRVVIDPAGEVVAMALVQMNVATAYIALLATRKDQRGRGLAQALLVDSFAVAAEHGATVSELSTDSRTGALGLYEKVGMTVTSTWLSRSVDLEPAS
jgi:GNAT superfamily N-acetyltransferase